MARMGDLAALPGLMDVQRCLRHVPEGAFRLLYYGLALRGLEALPAPEQLVAPHSAEAPQISVLIPVHNHWAITLNALRSLVLLVGSLVGAAGEIAQRLQHLRPEWALVEKPTELLQKPEAMRLPALPGWDRQELRILASSTGLHTDGWLETPSRLVIQLLGEGERAGGLRLGLYLPEQGLQRDDPTVLIQLDVEEPISQVLKPGLNTIVVPRSASPAQSVVVLNLSGEPLVQPANASDQRRLMAVLAELELLQQHSQGFT